MLSKDQVLSLYLELAPYGGNIEGIRAASLAYFGKEPRRLTLGQAALLVALPQSPELRRPDRFPQAARIARNRVLDRYAAAGNRVGRRDRARQGRTGAYRAAADADVGAARGRPGDRGRPGSEGDSADHRRRPAEEPAGAGARTRPHAGAGAQPRYLACHPRRRQRHGRGFGPCRLARLFRPTPRRRSGHDAGAALAGLDPQAFHLRHRLRGRVHPSANADRRSAAALRRLRAAQFQFQLRRHGHRPPGAAAIAQHAGGRRARPGRSEPIDGAARAGGRRRWSCPRVRRPDLPSASAASARNSPIW